MSPWWTKSIYCKHAPVSSCSAAWADVGVAAKTALRPVRLPRRRRRRQESASGQKISIPIDGEATRPGTSLQRSFGTGHAAELIWACPARNEPAMRPIEEQSWPTDDADNSHRRGAISTPGQRRGSTSHVITVAAADIQVAAALSKSRQYALQLCIGGQRECSAQQQHRHE